MNTKKVPEGTISRLFIYLREITELTKINIHTISSAELGERTNLSDAQVRKLMEDVCPSESRVAMLNVSGLVRHDAAVRPASISGALRRVT